MDETALPGDELMSTLDNAEGSGHGFRHGCGRGMGPSSFWMHDPEVLFNAIRLKRGDTFLDLGCGSGDYAVYAAQIVGEDGVVYALDRWQEMIGDLLAKTDSQGLENIIGVIADITAPLPLQEHCIDVCMIATVLHTLDTGRAVRTLFTEIRRVLKPDGYLAVIECKKEEMSFGPPMHIRLSPEEIEELAVPCGFKRAAFTDLGYNYLIQYSVLR